MRLLGCAAEPLELTSRTMVHQLPGMRPSSRLESPARRIPTIAGRNAISFTVSSSMEIDSTDLAVQNAVGDVLTVHVVSHLPSQIYFDVCRLFACVYVIYYVHVRIMYPYIKCIESVDICSIT